jgi:curved DNA-binding protein CbpA
MSGPSPTAPPTGGALTADEMHAIDALWAVARTGDHYDVLGISDDADRREVQRAFFELSRQWHPDRFFRRDTGQYGERLEAVFIAITEAYRTLSNDSARAAWDQSRARARPQVPSAAAASGPAPALRRAAAARTTAAMNRTMDEMREQVLARMKRARRLFLDGKQALEEGNPLKAASALAMAVTYDPKNAEYVALAERARKEARKIQAGQFISVAENAESFGNWKEALSNWQQAVEFGSPDPRAHFRMGVLLKRVEEDLRGALAAVRESVRLSPDNIEFRLSLGELYTEAGLSINARAQYEHVLKLDKSNAKAKEGLKSLK